MRLFRTLVGGVLVLILAVPSPLFAQQHAVDPAQLAGAVEQHAAQQQADRGAVHEALNRPEVRDMAARLGIDLERAKSAVATMNGLELEQAAAAARQVNQTLVGGATVVITATTIIIALLVILLLVVLID
jgi:hypothetical protein